MELDAIGDGQTMPSQRQVVIMGNRCIRAGTERGSQSESNLPLEGVAGDVAHLAANRVEALSFALTNFYRQELEEMTIAVRSTCPGSLGAIQ